MSDDFDFYRSPRDRREIVAEQMQRLAFNKPGAEQPKRQGPMDMTDEEREAAAVRRDRLFADGYVTVKGAPYPLSKVLAKQLGFDVDRLPRANPGYEAGDEEGRTD